MAESPDVNALRRRGRRRLVGAIALVLLAAIVLPMVFDPEPKSGVPPVSVRIPSEDESPFSPKATRGAPAAPAQTPAETPSPPPAKVTPPAAAAPAPAAKEIPQAPEKPPAPAEAKPASAVEQFVVPVAALAQPAKVKELVAKLKAARLPHYTEPVATAGGTVTRVRVGPFANRDAAEEARGRLERIGLKPGQVLAKP